MQNAKSPTNLIAIPLSDLRCWLRGNSNTKLQCTVDQFYGWHIHFHAYSHMNKGWPHLNVRRRKTVSTNREKKCLQVQNEPKMHVFTHKSGWMEWIIRLKSVNSISIIVPFERGQMYEIWYTLYVAVPYVVVTQRPHICEMNHLKWLKVIMGIRRMSEDIRLNHTTTMCDAAHVT